MKSVTQLYKYLETNTQDFDGAHDIFTPRFLVEDMISRTDKSKTYLVLFNIEIAISLVYSYNVDISGITFYADHPNKAKWAERIGVKYIMSLDNIPEKSFDYVLLNPPFDYIRQFRAMAEKMAKEKVILVSDINNMDYDKSFDNIEYFKILGGNVFNAQMETCYSVINPNGKTGPTTVVDQQGNVITANSVPFLPGKDLDIWNKAVSIHALGLPGYDVVWGKLEKNKIRKAVTGVNIITFNGKKNQPFDHVVGDSAHLPDLGNYGVHKVIMAKNSTIGKLGPAKYADPSFGCSHNIVSIAFGSEKDARDAADYLNSDEVAKLVKGIKTKSIVNSQAILSKIPRLQYAAQWTPLL